MEIKRIEKVNLVDEVFKQLREMILSGNLPEGTKLASENELARRFSVSRVVIREALQLLRGEKLIVTRQGVGTYVTNPCNYSYVDQSIDLSEDDYRKFLQFRDSLETTVIAISKDTATEEDYARLETCIAGMRDNEDDIFKFTEADFEFHLAIIKCAHNHFFENAMLANRQVLTSVLLKLNSVPGSRGFGVKTHQFICDEMRKRNIKAVINQYHDMDKYNLARLPSFFYEKKES